MLKGISLFLTKNCPRLAAGARRKITRPGIDGSAARREGFRPPECRRSCHTEPLASILPDRRETMPEVSFPIPC